MTASKRWLPVVAFLATLLVLPGCVKVKWFVTIYPDDSGKLELTIGMNSMSPVSEMGGKGGGEGVSSALAGPQEIAEGSKGFVAWTAPEESKSGDFKMTKVTGYFEDIDDVALSMESKDKEDAEPTTWTFKKNEDGTFEMSFVDTSMSDDIGEQGGQMGDDDSPEAKAMGKAMAKSMMAGFEISYSFLMPGEVTEAEGMEIDGRRATMKIDIDRLFDMDEKDTEKGFQGLVKSGPPVEGLEEEIVAFKKEMEEAKVAWKKMLEEAKAEKEGDEKKEPAKDADNGNEGGGENGAEGKERKELAPASAL